MSLDQPTRRSLARVHPRNCWYMLATTEEVGREPLGRRLDTGLCCIAPLMERLSRWRTDASTGLIRSALAASRETTSSPATQASSTTHEASASTSRRRARSRWALGYGHTRSMKMAFSCGPGWVSPRWPAATAGHALAQRPRLGDTRRCLGDRSRPAAAPRELRRHHSRRGRRPLYRATCVAQLAAAARWRSPRRQFRSPGRTSLRRFPPGRRSFSDCRPTPNTSSMSRALS